MMLTRTRISGKMDTSRMGQAVSRPGIDPRAWVSLAVALDDSKVDPKYGVFVNVQLVPTGEKYTAIVASDYAGKGFGLYTPILANDDLVVVIPLGDPRLGVTVVKRLWTAADTPPAEAVLDPTEVMLVVEPNKNLRLKVTGTGKVEIDSDATVTVKAGTDVVIEGAARVIAKSPAVFLGDENATEQLVLGTTYRGQEAVMNGILGPDFLADAAAWGVLATAYASAATEITGPFATLYPTTAAFLTAIGTAATAVATTAGANGTAVNAFEAAAATYLSQVSKTK